MRPGKRDDKFTALVHLAFYNHTSAGGVNYFFGQIQTDTTALYILVQPAVHVKYLTKASLGYAFSVIGYA